MATGISSGGLTYMVVSIVLGILTTSATAWRFHERSQLQRFARAQSSNVKAGIWHDDWSCLAATVVFWGMVVEATIFATLGGVGFPTQDLSYEQLSVFFKVFFANQVTYSVLCPLIKVSLLELYLRIFGALRYMRWSIRILETLVTAWGIAVLCVSIFQCHPISYFWNRTIDGHCVDAQKFFWGNAISNLLLDVMIWMLPIVPIWHLKTGTLRQKIALTSVFLLGAFACITTILRIVTLGINNDIDIALTLSQPAIWTTVEPGVAIICACLPTYWPRMRQWRSQRRVKGESRGTPSGSKSKDKFTSSGQSLQ